jgi:Family of unknown function (DUF6516)
MKNDHTLEYLLDLQGVNYVIDEVLGLWVKFEVKKVSKTRREHGIKYSLSLHDRCNKRLLGFDNAHKIEYDGKQNVAPKKTYDHWHKDEFDQGRPYHYLNAEKLLSDFYAEVDKKVKEILEGLI